MSSETKNECVEIDASPEEEAREAPRCGSLIANIRAAVAGSQGTLVVGIKGAPGSGRYGKASVSFDSGVKDNSVSMRILEGENVELKISDVPEGSIPPTCDLNIMF